MRTRLVSATRTVRGWIDAVRTRSVAGIRLAEALGSVWGTSSDPGCSLGGHVVFTPPRRLDHDPDAPLRSDKVPHSGPATTLAHVQGLAGVVFLCQAHLAWLLENSFVVDGVCAWLPDGGTWTLSPVARGAADADWRRRNTPKPVNGRGPRARRMKAIWRGRLAHSRRDDGEILYRGTCEGDHRWNREGVRGDLLITSDRIVARPGQGIQTFYFDWSSRPIEVVVTRRRSGMGDLEFSGRGEQSVTYPRVTNIDAAVSALGKARVRLHIREADGVLDDGA